MTDPEKFPSLVACPTCGAVSVNDPDPCPVCARVAAAVAAEREACAKIAEGMYTAHRMYTLACVEIAAAIRARGAKAQ